MDNPESDPAHQPEHQDLQPEQLMARGTHAHLTGESARGLDLLHQAFVKFGEQHQPAQALQAAFRITMIYGTSGQPALFNGWLARSRSLLAEHGSAADGLPPALEVAAGYHGVLQLHQALLSGGFAVVTQQAAEILRLGRIHHNADLQALALVASGRSSIYAGRVPAGLDMLDEAMALVLAGECEAIPTGLVWCAAIEACQEIGAIDRVSQWTEALASWRAERPQITAFGGECSLHTGQILALRGSWGAAIDEFTTSCQRFELRSQPYSAGVAQRERGDLLRIQGDFDAAETAYQAAAEHGCDPQPGLALLWLANGSTDAALAAIRRCLDERQLPAQRLALLPAGIEIELQLGTRDAAERLLSELDGQADATGCLITLAAAAYAHADLELSKDDAHGALPYARKAVQDFGQIRAPYLCARSRVLLARTLLAVGDTRSFHAEMQAATATFEQLGATPQRAAAQSLLQEVGHAEPAPGGLTAREVQVLQLVSAGHSNRQIAQKLYLSEKTVARHLSNIFIKIQVPSRTAAAAWAYEHALA
ncbi:helix-turn-helix transcriptional regulator [Arthrobacter sp. MYb224]|uniref:helix-turn-helix transcriptional regulator n=1 Tax=Arthrobacter sp. MYb224 TaxID=1848600 RepID=UPI000CFC4525|nr:helix-turn-helix transcriptional regulator [Arthrobacter sp. MYb224]PRA00978.1 helix-turn-helix transcriptional regulator [Arthrobacter sp. MYb224]